MARPLPNDRPASVRSSRTSKLPVSAEGISNCAPLRSAGSPPAESPGPTGPRNGWLDGCHADSRSRVPSGGWSALWRARPHTAAVARLTLGWSTEQGLSHYVPVVLVTHTTSAANFRVHEWHVDCRPAGLFPTGSWRAPARLAAGCLRPINLGPALCLRPLLGPLELEC
jgi:hypothetical protein